MLPDIPKPLEGYIRIESFISVEKEQFVSSLRVVFVHFLILYLLYVFVIFFSFLLGWLIFICRGFVDILWNCLVCMFNLEDLGLRAIGDGDIGYDVFYYSLSIGYYTFMDLILTFQIFETWNLISYYFRNTVTENWVLFHFIPTYSIYFVEF